ncbi:glycogen/starch synthase, ADP-glucose type [Desulfofarcimen acetoxidans DSM 771]|jgi:starch synthase|uniref:Glycogen synthase n=1 Tax=Desulfofarcimen acetoxidans (strain ATCC 49208 / DSM 771 / KCTC 5769 / VKM B-1644 / 5575) TaxID=485916 RepID=C8VWX7_DESAS|nr:glycogen synthase [Desulfofarcimen acetoxidans]ACV62553.1 glycogen/starch synthase, ADP-glucose type [Desulfofarcimen acetoxidans DSM 771]
MFDRPLKILLVSSEVAPFAKTGGLADVAGSLPKALSLVGTDHNINDVRLVMPHYKQIEGSDYLMDFPVKFGDRVETAIIRTSSIEAHYKRQDKAIPVYMIDNHHYFYRDGMYMFDDDPIRFTFFCRSLLEMLPKLNWQPDIIHCNDWQSGPIPFFLKTKYRHDPFYNKTATVFTIHNLRYQGNYSKELLRYFGVGDEYFTPDLLEFYGNLSFLKTGVLYADLVSTVSKTYAREIQRPELGEHMDGLLRKRSNDLYGILNGINIHEFDPKTDPRIYRNYDAESLDKKRENKFLLQKEMGLPVKDLPVLGLISRLVDQKGLDLFIPVIDDLMKEDVQLIMLGLGDPYYHDLFERIQEKYPQKVAVHIAFNPVLAQRIYAGSDMFLMPSHYEPCGLGQLISFRYGTIPIVRATGGLADTVKDYHASPGTGNGFVFLEYEGNAFRQAVRRALKVYREEPHNWRKLVKNSMELDFSWARSAVEYIQLYQTALAKRNIAVKTA